jgi:hypothetical protein
MKFAANVDLTPTPSDSPMATPSTHIDGNLIPVKTKLGKDLCDDRFSDTDFCIEVLRFKGVPSTAEALVVRGIKSASKIYPVLSEELVVNWNEFGESGGLQNYLAVVLWHSSIVLNIKVDQLKNEISEDVCQFMIVKDGLLNGEAVTPSACHSIIINYLQNNRKNASMWSNGRVSNGYVIFVPDLIWNINIDNEESDPSILENDPRKISAHEYFHAYQNIHTTNQLEITSDNVPIWLIEGSAEYAAYYVAQQNEWIDWHTQLKSIINDVKEFMLENPYLSLKDLETYEQKEQHSEEPYYHTLAYKLSTLAVVHMTKLSSDEAIMKNYWDDINVYGNRASFLRNTGFNVTDYYKLFDKFIQNDSESIYIALKNFDEK